MLIDATVDPSLGTPARPFQDRLAASSSGLLPRFCGKAEPIRQVVDRPVLENSHGDDSGDVGIAR
ncbi:MAG: hypothetical protein SFV23_24325 [Planctomycetaceae bacterium]|nr:hypothetical protein [Planctomycetaceae bacterium]